MTSGRQTSSAAWSFFLAHREAVQFNYVWCPRNSPSSIMYGVPGTLLTLLSPELSGVPGTLHPGTRGDRYGVPGTRVPGTRGAVSSPLLSQRRSTAQFGLHSDPAQISSVCNGDSDLWYNGLSS